MKNPKIKAGDVLGDAIRACGREKEVLGLLVALTTIVFLLGLWPLRDTYSLVMVGTGDPQETGRLLFQDFFDNRAYLGISSLAFLAVSYSVSMVWSRVCVLGRGAALDGGPGQFLKRAGWTFWRNLCAAGWMMLFLGIPIAIVAALDPGRATGDSMAPAAVWLVVVPLFVVGVGAAFAIGTLIPIAVHGEARDFHLPIHRAFVLMRGNLARATGLFVLAVLLFEIAIVIVFAIFGPALLEAAGWIRLAGMFIFTALGLLVEFLVGAYGAYFAVRVVPQLKA